MSRLIVVALGFAALLCLLFLLGSEARSPLSIDQALATDSSRPGESPSGPVHDDRTELEDSSRTRILSGTVVDALTNGAIQASLLPLDGGGGSAHALEW